ncbi:D-alanyl-D-alanine carboxypeptidase family protein [Thalassobacillus pellis]|uniref:D-alanyl-D-alanine carboxypeptidase family protein n=1 Tax=Thalassobacillus pellis TaxID=748008 RepID=UPI00196208CE|nr:D-alanyl-D-alanine carboxypeptidase family protein [Thalassobacillus pellis]MBM7553671.1 LAS superfamily LD-carboxypeptidase LdcB [Thalassobacillus pellis]
MKDYIFTKKPRLIMALSLILSLATPVIGLAHDKSDILLVNKQQSLSETYFPENLMIPEVDFSGDKEKMQAKAANALEAMFNQAEQDGVQLYAASGYRSYHYQEDLFQYWVNQYGEQEANRFSAKPGESEHQTGLTMDVTSAAVDFQLEQSFGETEAGKWLEQHASEFGFIIRYPEGKEAVTGYTYEPWHLRYIGTDHARKVDSLHVTLETYLSIPASNLHTVEAGDTLYSLAKDNGTTVIVIKALNPGIKTDYLQIGESIFLPGASSTPEQPSLDYKIKEGDTFNQIAASFGSVTVDDLRAANPEVNAHELEIGKIINVPK